ncbi:superoxide dismutase [Bacillus tianshenii]|nr:superoxide dismutase [Bacillus tianshenii]
MEKGYTEQVKEWAEDFKQKVQALITDKEDYERWEEGFQQWLDDLEVNRNEPAEVEREAEAFYEQARVLIEGGDVRAEDNEKSVPIGGHKLPPLPYAYNALEPYIAEEIMRLHHLKHHQSYVEGLNKAEKMMEKARKKDDYELLKHWEREAAFHGSGHYLHTIFWNNMIPKGGGKPSGALLKQIEKDFGSFEKFKAHFTNAANQAEGVGWAILVWSPRARRLEILQSEKHQFFTQWDTIPLLVLDVWEHAYYLQYKNQRKDYVKNWWNIVNWKDVAERFTEASKLKWKPY